jgi:hypothetical protein
MLAGTGGDVLPKTERLRSKKGRIHHEEKEKFYFLGSFGFQFLSTASITRGRGRIFYGSPRFGGSA